jgi:hypothetical protein
MAVNLSALRIGRRLPPPPPAHLPPPHLPPQEDSWYSFLLQAESNPGP